jgi:general secretion pathway protein G
MNFFVLHSDTLFSVRKMRQRSAHGFTLIELLFALTAVAILASLAVSSYASFILKARDDKAIVAIKSIEVCIEHFRSNAFTLPPDLATASCAQNDPWGNPYKYCDIEDAPSGQKGNKGVGGCTVRKDRSLHPINSDYDLYSMGADGQSVAPLTAQASQDDIIRARNGEFVDLAVNY